MDLSNLQVEINPDYTMMKKLSNGLYLSQEQIDILEEFNIDYMSCKSLSDLIYVIEEINNEAEYDVLSNLLDVLQERNYYENFNK